MFNFVHGKINGHSNICVVILKYDMLEDIVRHIYVSFITDTDRHLIYTLASPHVDMFMPSCSDILHYICMWKQRELTNFVYYNHER